MRSPWNPPQFVVHVGDCVFHATAKVCSYRLVLTSSGLPGPGSWEAQVYDGAA